MDLFVAVTDSGWYEHLSQTPGPKDANFWRPSGRAFRLEVGTPFLFKLKAPNHAIVGFGYFAGFSVLPDWLAWDTFGDANGVAGLGELRARLSRSRDGAHIEAEPGGYIGCCLIAEACFFPRTAWASAPRNWSPRIQTGAKYDLSRDDGRRIWQECLERASHPTADLLAVAEPAARYGAPTVQIPRLGQGIFRVKVLDAYGRACAVTREHSLPVLEAAHIRPNASGGEHSVRNGLALRSDIHRLFDRGYVTVDGEQRLVVGRRLKDEFENGRSYYGLNGQSLSLPDSAPMRPSDAELQWHREHVFLG